MCRASSVEKGSCGGVEQQNLHEVSSIGQPLMTDQTILLAVSEQTANINVALFERSQHQRSNSFCVTGLTQSADAILREANGEVTLGRSQRIATQLSCQPMEVATVSHRMK